MVILLIWKQKIETEKNILMVAEKLYLGMVIGFVYNHACVRMFLLLLFYLIVYFGLCYRIMLVQN